jgi:hypothetical protein
MTHGAELMANISSASRISLGKCPGERASRIQLLGIPLAMSSDA